MGKVVYEAGPGRYHVEVFWGEEEGWEVDETFDGLLDAKNTADYRAKLHSRPYRVVDTAQ